MKYIRLFEKEANVERIIHLTKLYDYLVENGFKNIRISRVNEDAPMISSLNVPITFSIYLSADIYKDITIRYIPTDYDRVKSINFKYWDYEGVLEFLKDLELQYDVKKYNL